MKWRRAFVKVLMQTEEFVSGVGLRISKILWKLREENCDRRCLSHRDILRGRVRALFKMQHKYM